MSGWDWYAQGDVPPIRGWGRSRRLSILEQGERLKQGFGLVLLVGEHPRGLAGSRASVSAIARLAGLSFPVGFVRFFDRVHLFEKDPGPKFPVVRARKRGEKIVRELCLGPEWTNEPPHARDVVVLGRKVWLSLGFGEEVFFSSVRERALEPEQIYGGSPRYWLLPKPTRTSRLWNHPETQEHARRILRDLVSDRRARGYPVQGVELEA